MLTESKKSGRRRLALLAFGLTFGLSVIVGQLVRYQVLLHAQLREEAESLVRNERDLDSRRGSIVDTNYQLLAGDVIHWDISVTPPFVVDADLVADELSERLGLSRDQVYAELVSNKPWVPLAKNVPQEIGEGLLALALPGVNCEPQPLRFYPQGDLFAHIVGIVNATGDGFYGIEGFYNSLLKGSRGQRVFWQDSGGRELPVPPIAENLPEDGASLVLTVDANIQLIVREELELALDLYGAESGTVIVMEPRTGAILASVSYPTYDPNEFADAEPELYADPAVSSMWEPGSIFKIITWAAGLDTGTISPGTTFYDQGALEVGGRVIQNWDRQGHGLVTMSDGLIQSLNTVAAFISTSTGKDRFYTYLRRFGFGSLTEVNLASEGPGMMKLPGDSNWFPSDLGTNAFGQGIAVTPIQMITAVAAVANDGMMMKPHIVRQFIVADESGQGHRVIQVEPMSSRLTISRETAETLKNMLVSVIEQGATQAQVPGYRVAGKTGTAQIPVPYGYDPSDTIASFVGFAPADDPRFIVLIKLDRPQASPWGSQTAAPTFRAIAERLFVYMQIPPDDIRLAQKQRGP